MRVRLGVLLPEFLRAAGSYYRRHPVQMVEWLCSAAGREAMETAEAARAVLRGMNILDWTSARADELAKCLATAGEVW